MKSNNRFANRDYRWPGCNNVGYLLCYCLKRLLVLCAIFVSAQLHASNAVSIDQKIYMLEGFLGQYESVSVGEKVKSNGATSEITPLTGPESSVAEEICGSDFYIQTTDKRKFLVLGVLTTFELTGEPANVEITSSVTKRGQELEIAGTIIAEDTEAGKPIGDETREFIYKFVKKIDGSVEGTAEITVTTPDIQQKGRFFSDTYVCELRKSRARVRKMDIE